MPQTINTNTTLSQLTIAAQKAKVIAAYQAVINGIVAELGDTTTFLVGGGTYTKADLVARFQARIDAAKKTLADRTALHASVATEQALSKTVATLRAGFKTYLQGRYGKDSPELQKFGMTPQKIAQRATATKAKAVLQNKATRTARGTTGKKAKSLIKGTVAQTVTVAPNAPATQASTAATPVAVGNAASTPAAGAGGATTPHIP